MAPSLRSLAAVGLAAVLPLAAAAGIEDSYFVQDGPTLFKAVLADGSSYQFEFDFSRPGRLVSAIGWSGAYDGKGRVRLSSPQGNILDFDRGRLVYLRWGGVERRFDYDLPRQAPANAVTPLAMLIYDEKKLSENYIEKEESVKWSDTGRLAFPYVNPNFSGALFAQISLLFFALAWSFRRRRVVGVSFAVVSVAALACAVWSGSRGALFGLFAGAGLGTAFAVVRRGVSRRLLWGGVAVAVLVLAVVFALGHENLMRGFGDEGGLTWSNALRVEMMKAAPRMMADAPNGWSAFGIGKAFTYWYQPLGMVLMSGSLINSHLTWLVGFGVVGRFLYLLVLFAFLFLSLRLAFRQRMLLPVSVLGGFAVMACFNPLFGVWGLWVVPALASVPLFMSFRQMGLKSLLRVVCWCTLASAVVTGGLMAIGATDGAYPSIEYDGARIMVNGSHPKTWIVDDGQGVIGGVLVGRDIREYFVSTRRMQAVGYVRDVRDLPSSGVERLVLPGKSGNDWLLMLSEDEKARERLPKSVLFLNPPFSPSEMPEGVLALCHPKLLVGEFAARYNSEYQTPPAWVGIVPGMEKYLAGWMAYALEE